MEQKKIHRNFPGIMYVRTNIKGGFYESKTYYHFRERKNKLTMEDNYEKFIIM